MDSSSFSDEKCGRMVYFAASVRGLDGEAIIEAECGRLVGHQPPHMSGFRGECEGEQGRIEWWTKG